MSTTHFSNFGWSSAPACADASGFISYSQKHVERLIDALEKGESFEDVARQIGASDGSVWVAEESARVEEWRS